MVHFNRLKPAPPQNTIEELGDDDIIVHRMPDLPLVGTPVGADHQTPTLEGLPQDRLNHPVPEMEHPAIVPQVLPPAAEEAPALRRSSRISKPPVRYGNSLVLPDNMDTAEIIE